MLVYTRRDSLAENRAMWIDRFLRILEIYIYMHTHTHTSLICIYIGLHIFLGSVSNFFMHY